MAKIKQPVDLGRRDAQLAGQRRLPDPIGAHGPVKLDLGDGQGREINMVGPKRFRSRNRLARRHASHKGGLDGVHRADQGFIPILTKGHRLREVGDGDKDGVVVVRREGDRIAHCVSS